MKLAEQIFCEVMKLPDTLAKEVLDFVEYLEHKYDIEKKRMQILINLSEH